MNTHRKNYLIDILESKRAGLSLERIRSGGEATSFATAMYKQKHGKLIPWSKKIGNQMKLDRLKDEIDSINIIINEIKHL
ncbi:MAG: hypothetical protein HOJ42_03860 [Gammaproteobacteria bacterium]|jgi:hypothetical protein|nr:hypothetical protein [Gammaproteobacteria bacterium]|tara:strand:+ start:51 stop:290 length:240 start_codon:yes stop_codon:yes gene_type:complete